MAAATAGCGWVGIRSLDSVTALCLRRRCFAGVEDSTPQCPFLQQQEKDRHKNQDMDGGRDHASDYWSSNRLHHVRSYAGLPEYWSKAQNNRRHGHQFRSESLNRTINGSPLDVTFSERRSIDKSVLQRFVEVNDH